jgi:hypothetical protein
MISPSISQVDWGDGTIKEFVRQHLYEALLSSDPDKAVEVLLRRRAELKDMNDFVGVHPSYWVQLRVSGRGLKRNERLVEDLFTNLGYCCEEWVGVDNSDARLGIFGPKGNSATKLVFCLDSRRDTLRCDLLLPVFDYAPVPCLAAGEVNLIAPRWRSTTRRMKASRTLRSLGEGG